MSELKEPQCPIQPTAATAAAASRFEMFVKFYSQAYALATSNTEANTIKDEDKEDHQRILITLDTISKLVFGLDEKNKSKFVLHGAGALELVIALVRKSEAKAENSEDECESQTTIQIAALKAIKTCVLRNSAGRSRCRSAGVLLWLTQVLETALKHNNALLAEEAFTTLAATCLGDDLNALQASCEVKSFIKTSKELFPTDSFTSMHQKTLYLETLFGAIEKEQMKLLRKIKTSNRRAASFFQNLDEAESNVRVGYSHLQDKKYVMSVKHYNHAMKLLNPFVADTNLLDDIVLEIRSKRSPAEFELGNLDNCLKDTRILLDKKDVGVEGERVHLLKLHSKALIKAGKVQEGKETLAKLKIICPEDNDDEISKLLEIMKIEDHS